MTGLLGDSAARDYAAKLRAFNAFAAPELKQLIAELAPGPALHVLDVGCGSGEALCWFAASAGAGSRLVGLDLASAHVRAARASVPPQVTVLQGNLLEPPFGAASFDLIWAVNTLNHLHDPVAGLRALSVLLRPRGCIAVGQSSLLPDMMFAWDARLEGAVTAAVRRYYQDRYAASERELTGVRGLVGWLQRAGAARWKARTVIIERVAPLDAPTERYLAETIFRDTWGERLRPWLAPEDFAELTALCDPASPRYALRRPDFHFLQTFTLVTGEW